ncbi:DISARM system helicase DrmA [Brevibacillus nitrificans]|uniref:DISARM system helicase DrmA n=1 Tax=Brevibacillus nitrificans TaxID=651560 RepID=UPI00285AA547|nr:DISARM system helicase DrmA [Brevibacillus nitrificans]MDR7316058.1 hypothetical protein [Brevibacillus nitrificans]
MKLTPIAKKLQEILIMHADGLTIKEITDHLSKNHTHVTEKQVDRSLTMYSDLFVKEHDVWRMESIVKQEQQSKRIDQIIESEPTDIRNQKSDLSFGSSDYELARENLLENLLRHLIGPSEKEEVLQERPNQHYLGGMLYPANAEIQLVEDNFELENDGEQTEQRKEDNAPEEELQVNRYYPSSIGLTCSIATDVTHLLVTCSFGVYHEIKEEKEKKKQYKRKQMDFYETINLMEGKGQFYLHQSECMWFVRNSESGRTLTVFLVNRNPSSIEVPIEDIMFQPEIRVESDGQITFPFVRRVLDTENFLDDEDVESFKLLYRNKAEFAVGHGCSVDWRFGEYNHERAALVKTALLPTYEVPAVQHLELPDLIGLDMNVLAYIEDQEKMKKVLTPLVTHYNEWIDKASQIKVSPHEDQQQKHMELCKAASDRIREGIDILSQDKQMFEAFKFANEVMLYQRSYSSWAAEYRSTKVRKGTPELKGKWRPFQLAFILLNIKSFYDPTCNERNWAELLWFPTGGGKTEAYLGLAAFVMALRRIRGVSKGVHAYAGTTVLMRYTLRLLTIQQFQRASSLICAADFLRSKNPVKWGDERFSIGLWVGGGTTPNTFTDAKESLIELQNNRKVYEGDPVQLHHCPWCGEDLTAHHYSADRDVFAIKCSNQSCYFHKNEIPAYTVDEAIYYKCPSILIGTVDKFARLPWNGGIASMFGHVDRYCQRHGFIRKGQDHQESHIATDGFSKSETIEIPSLLPPELIIQDELHLISGPLGSMVGLYETAIDFLCTNESIRPKVVASTATIRRSKEQMLGVFNREVRQFPPSGVDSGDSFFSYEVSREEKPGRKYVGLFFPGASGKTSLVRVYAALLQTVHEMKQEQNELVDPYWTLVGYFNSLRELGGTVRLIEDDIDDRIRYLSDKNTGRRYINNTEELTSRIPASDIPKILTKLEQPVNGKYPVDVLLATNMISVGVDIDRLGLMVVTGQPKGTSEYIQATSRVGRKYPGLVFTLYNWSRPRDISHYEQFISYHSKMYSFVEATSVTPFSYRARDKALSAVVIGILRQLDEGLFKNSYAKHFSSDNEYLQLLKSIIIDRCKEIEKIDFENIEEEVEEIITWWHNRTQEHPDSLDYAQYKFTKRDTPVLLRGINQNIKGARLIPDSMRDVEAEVSVYYLDIEEDTQP